MESRRRVLGPQAPLPEDDIAQAPQGSSTVCLYGTVGCHLCDEAKALIQGLLEHEGWCLIECDIAEQDGLYDRYCMRIPVLRRHDDCRELDWPFDAEQVRRFLR